MDLVGSPVVQPIVLHRHFVTQFEVADVEPVGEIASGIDQGPRTLVVDGPHAAGVEVRKADKKTSEQRPFDQHQREGAARRSVAGGL